MKTTESINSNCLPNPVCGSKDLYHKKPKAHRAAGWLLERVADGLSAYRAIDGVLAATEIRNNHDYQNWKTVGRFAINQLTDLEGNLARFGRKIAGDDESKPRPRASYTDHIADKIATHSFLLAIASQESKRGNDTYAKVVQVCGATILARDVLTTCDRVSADIQGGIDTRAQLSGKAKTLLTSVVIGFALSPLADSTVGRAISGAGLMLATNQSIASGLSLHQYLQESRQTQQTTDILDIESDRPRTSLA